MKADGTKILDDIAGLAGGALSLVGSAKQQVKEDLNLKINDFISGLDLVSREEFDRVEAMLTKSREQQEILLDRIEKLEDKINSIK